MNRNRRKLYTRGMLTAVTAIVLGLVSSGCDEGKSQEVLVVDPPNIELTRNQEAVRFSVTEGLRELSIPLTWRVSNTAVGNIVAAEGPYADYVRFTSGINIIVVRDQYGAEGYATVSSPGSGVAPPSGYNLILVANPDVEIPEGVNTVSITVINGEAPFSWSVGDPARGSVSGGTADTATYRSSAPGDNTVICTDRNGARGTIIITQLPRP